MLVVDFETRSSVDLKVEGSMRYAMHPSTRILCCGYKVDNGPVQLWMPGVPLPVEFTDYSHKVYAFNAPFDWLIWNTVGEQHCGFPPLDIRRVVDVQGLCGRYGLPQSLFEATRTLKLSTVKDAGNVGKRLIEMFCKPPYGRGNDGHIKQQVQHLWVDFLNYCKDDVESTYQLVKALPADTLSKEEQAIWQLNHEINMNGIPVDVPAAKRILEVTATYLDEHNGRLASITNGQVTKVTQVKRIKTWCASQGLELDDLTKETVEKLLQREDLDEGVVEVLELRAGLGLSSIGKYKRIRDMEYNGRMHFNSRYYGAHTGRITGLGFQLLNLPRAKVDDPEAEIEKFMTGDIVYENPVISARALIRPMIHPEEPNELMVADYKSVEYVTLMWLADDFKALQRFEADFDQYVDLATEMYKVAYEEVDAFQRQMGKMGILGCGYGLGAEGYVRYADDWGVKLTVPEARKTVEAFRTKHSTVVNCWYKLKDAAMAAVVNPGIPFTAYKTTFKSVRDRNKRPWLAMLLPSGRTMYYGEPEIREGKYGDAVTVLGMNQLTRKYERKFMTPGKFCENVVQAISRDLLYTGKMALRKAGYKIIGSIYDEVIVEVKAGTKSFEDFTALMCTLPEWARGLPLQADGYTSTRYKKG